MESNESSSITDDGNLKHSTINPSRNKKMKLEKEIEELKNTLQELQKELNVVKMQRSLTESNTNDVSDMSNKVTPPDIRLELYRYGGLYCMKSDNDKKVVGLNSSAKEQHENEFAIQFIKQGKNIKIGKWVMPMSVDVEQLQAEVQVKSTRNVLHFIRNCKQHTDCHESRLQQFKELKFFADNLKNCNVQTNLGYTFVTLELLHVHDKINNSYLNVNIYLWYNSKCGRPTNVKFEIPDSAIHDKKTQIQLKKSLKVFRSNNLRTAFDQIFNKNNTQFVWERAEKRDEIYEMNESSSSLDDEVSTYRKLPQERITNKRLKKVSKKRSNKKKKEDNSIEDLNQENADVEEINKPTYSGAPLEVKSNITKNKLMYQSTLDRFANKLHLTRQKKKDLKIIENKFNIKPLVVKVRKLNVKYTSTPIKSIPHSNTPFKVLPSIDLSQITLNNSYE